MDKKTQLRNNVYKNYIYVLLQNVDLTRGIWMLYLASKGMSLTKLGLLETIFHITSFVMEVPTGAVADLFGRKISRICGRVAALLSVTLLLTANSFLWFSISFIFSALSYNLESGAGDALVYDSLKEIGEEDKYMKAAGKKELFYQIASTISFLVGGYMAIKNYNTVFILTIIIGVITLFESFSFREPSIGRLRKNEENNENIFILQLKNSINVIRNNLKVGSLIIFVELIMTFCTCMFYYLQNYLKGDGFNEAKIGLLYASASLVSAFTATRVHWIEKKIKERGILLIVPIIVVASIWGVVLSKYNYIFFIVITVMEGVAYVAIGDYINKMIPSENRATILSFESMVFSFLMITMFPLVGLIGDKYSLVTAFKCLGVLGIIFVILNSCILFSNKNRLASGKSVYKRMGGKYE